jgi:hypothetical protein
MWKRTDIKSVVNKIGIHGWKDLIYIVLLAFMLGYFAYYIVDAVFFGFV